MSLKSVFIFQIRHIVPKVSGIGIMCYLPQNTYIYRAFSKIHLAVPACSAGFNTEHTELYSLKQTPRCSSMLAACLYREHFSNGHVALQTYYLNASESFLDFSMKCKLINFKTTIINLFLFSNRTFGLKVPWIGIRLFLCYKIFLYVGTEHFSKILLAVLAYCAG